MEKVGGRFLQELRGTCINFLYKIKIFYIGTRVSLIMYWLSVYLKYRDVVIDQILGLHCIEVSSYDCCQQMSDFKAKMHQIRFRLDPLARFKGPTSKGRQEREREGRKEREGKGGLLQGLRGIDAPEFNHSSKEPTSESGDAITRVFISASTWSPVEVTPSLNINSAEETMNSANSSISNSSDTAGDDGGSLFAQPTNGNITTQQSTAGKTKRDDGPAKAADNPLPSAPVPEPQRAAPPYRDDIDVAFRATVQHHVTAFVTWHEPAVSACDSGGLTSGPAVAGYRLRYGHTAASSSTPVEMSLRSNVAAIDGLTPSSEYWYQLQYVYDDGSHSPWTEKHLIET